MKGSLELHIVEKVGTYVKEHPAETGYVFSVKRRTKRGRDRGFKRSSQCLQEAKDGFHDPLVIP